MANVQIQTPEKFDLKNPDAWSSWKKRFEQFRIASGLSETDEARQISMLLYCIGPEAESMLDSTNITTGQRKKYDTVVAKLDSFFQVRKNTIFERARFNRRCQGPDESAEEYITALFALAETCYGDLRDELIRDRLVVGIKDTTLSEHLQLDAGLTLERAMKAVRQREAVREQQTMLSKTETPGTDTPDKLDSVKTKPKFKQPFRRTGKVDSKPCGRCGRGCHGRDKCPAKDATCHKCQKKGHFSSQCFSKRTATQHSVEVNPSDSTHSSEETTTFLDVVQTGSDTVWNATIQLNQQHVTFKLDTGAEVTAISHTIYKEKLPYIKLQPSSKSLVGPARQKLEVLGQFSGTLSTNQSTAEQTIFVVKNLRSNLLGLPAILALKLVVRVAEVSEDYSSAILKKYPKVFTGLGTMQGEYTIKLQAEVQPHAIYIARNVPIPLCEKVQTELTRMENLGVIS